MDVVKNNHLVCFADKNPGWLAGDRFLVVVTYEPNELVRAMAAVNAARVGTRILTRDSLVLSG
jgi:hypothetical protein